MLVELAKSCRAIRPSMGIYVYPGDETWGAAMGSGGRTKDPAKQEEYNKIFRQQLREALERLRATARSSKCGSTAVA